VDAPRRSSLGLVVDPGRGAAASGAAGDDEAADRRRRTARSSSSSARRVFGCRQRRHPFTFAPVSTRPPQAGLERVEEGRFGDGVGQRGRVLNGDQTHRTPSLRHLGHPARAAVSLSLVVIPGLTRNPPCFRRPARWMPDQVRHDGRSLERLSSKEEVPRRCHPHVLHMTGLPRVPRADAEITEEAILIMRSSLDVALDRGRRRIVIVAQRDQPSGAHYPNPPNR
jgi:hypothetical protein